MKLFPILPYIHVLLHLKPEFGEKMFDNLEHVPALRNLQFRSQIKRICNPTPLPPSVFKELYA